MFGEFFVLLSPRPNVCGITRGSCYRAPRPCFPDSVMKARRQKDREERLSLVVWKRPLTTLHYFLLEALLETKEWTLK